MIGQSVLAECGQSRAEEFALARSGREVALRKGGLFDRQRGKAVSQQFIRLLAGQVRGRVRVDLSA